MKRFMILLLLLGICVSTSELFSQRAKSLRSTTFLGGEVGLGIPTGDFADAVNTGFGLNGVLSYFLQRDLLLTGTLGYWSFGKSQGGVDLTFTTIPLNVGLNYRFGTTNVIPYIGAETFLFFNTANIKYYGVSESDSETKFGFVPLFGFSYLINPTLEFRGTLKYHIIFTEGSNTTFLGLILGLHFPI
ncbi:MAG: outer membrane beta-barrel protein [Candidatus Kapaibacteriota bacterium]